MLFANRIEPWYSAKRFLVVARLLHFSDAGQFSVIGKLFTQVSALAGVMRL